MRARRRLDVLVAGLGALLTLAAPISVGAALEVWTLAAVPTSTTAGTPTTFTLTASNLAIPAGIGCLEVDLPASFTNVSAQVKQTPRDARGASPSPAPTSWSTASAGAVGSAPWSR